MKYILSLLVSLLLITSISIQAQDQEIMLDLGVEVGDKFSFSVEIQNGEGPTMGQYLNPTDLSFNFEDPFPDSFSIEVHEITQMIDESVCYIITSEDCLYLGPIIQVIFDGVNITGKADLQLGLGSGLITTNDWDEVDAYLEALTTSDFYENLTYSYSINDVGIYKEIRFEANGSISFGENSFSFSGYSESVYHAQTGVLQREDTDSTATILGVSTHSDYIITNDDYDPDSNTESGGDLSIPAFQFLYLFGLVPIVLIRRKK